MIEDTENDGAEPAETGKRAYTKKEKKVESVERFPVVRNGLTVFRTEEEYAVMEKDGWKRA